MKLTKTKLKQLIKETLNEHGAESAVDPRSAVELVADQLDSALETWSAQGDEGDTARMQANLAQIAQDLRQAIEASGQ
jgi:hypothetical protein